MRWFKHFTDNHRGRTVQGLFDELGPIGPLCYFIIIELCAEKLEKPTDRPTTLDDCVFVFNAHVLQFATRAKRFTIESVLTHCSVAGVLEWKRNVNEITIKLPMLLNLLDREMKKPRAKRDSDAGNPRLDIDIDKDIDIYKESSQQDGADARPKGLHLIKEKDSDPSRQDLFNKFYEQYPVSTKGCGAEKRFHDQIKTPEDEENLQRALDHYKKHLIEHSWRKAKTSFATFLGTKSSGHFWHDWIDPNAGKLKIKKPEPIHRA